MLYFCSNGSSVEERAYTQSALRTTRECPVVVFRLRNVIQGRIVSNFFAQFNRQWLSNAKSVFLEYVCVCLWCRHRQDGWRIACHFFPIHVHPSIRIPPSCCVGVVPPSKCTRRPPHSTTTQIKENHHELFMVGYYAGRQDDVAVAWAFAQLTAVSPESLRFLAPGVHPKCRLWTQSVSQSVRRRFAISRIDTVMFSVRPRCPLPFSIRRLILYKCAASRRRRRLISIFTFGRLSLIILLPWAAKDS